MQFFPPDSPCGVEWAEVALERLGEQPLHPAAPNQPLVVRLLCLPTWSPACSVRLDRVGLSCRLLARELDGEEAGFELGELAHSYEVLAAKPDAERIAELWEYLQFWSITPTGGQELLDGTSYLLEAAEKGRYRVVVRDDPEWGDTFGEFADLLVSLSGLAPR